MGSRAFQELVEPFLQSPVKLSTQVAPMGRKCIERREVQEPSEQVLFIQWLEPSGISCPRLELPQKQGLLVTRSFLALASCDLLVRPGSSAALRVHQWPDALGSGELY